MNRAKIKVAVLFGGQSAEHEISLESARTVLANLDPRRYEALPIRIDRAGRWLLERRPGDAGLSVLPSTSARGTLIPVSSSPPRLTRSGLSGIDVVFPILHGPLGEDGTVQGFLELAHLPYVGCGVLTSSVGMDKDVSKRLAASAGIPVLPHVLLRSKKDLTRQAQAVKALGLPLFVKPARLGSSVGVAKVKKISQLPEAVRRAFQFDTKVMIEKGVEGREICCAVLGEAGSVATSVCGEIEVTGAHEFFDYDAKYFDDSGHRLIIPARLTPAQSSRIRKLAAQTFDAFDGNGMARVDFFVERKTGRISLGEINTIPGFTSHSLYPKLWEASGLPIPKLLDRLIALALSRHRRQSRLRQKP